MLAFWGRWTVGGWILARLLKSARENGVNYLEDYLIVFIYLSFKYRCILPRNEHIVSHREMKIKFRTRNVTPEQFVKFFLIDISKEEKKQSLKEYCLISSVWAINSVRTGNFTCKCLGFCSINIYWIAWKLFFLPL